MVAPGSGQWGAYRAGSGLAAMGTTARLGANMQRIAPLLPIGLVVAVGLALGSPRSIGAAPSHPRTADVPAIHALLALHRPTFARTGPNADAAPIRLLAARTPLTRS